MDFLIAFSQFFPDFKAFFSILLQLYSSFLVNSSFKNSAFSKAIFGKFD